MNSCALCIYIYFVCLSLHYHKAYTSLIFYHLNDFDLSSFPVFAMQNFHHAAVVKSLSFRQIQIIARFQIESNEKKLKLMEIKKLNRKEESDLRDVLKNSCSKHLISLLQTIKKFCRKDLTRLLQTKNIKGIVRITSNSYKGAFLQEKLMVERH